MVSQLSFWEFTKSIVLCRKLFLYAIILMPSSVNTIVNRHVINRSSSRRDVLADGKNSLLVVDNIFVLVYW